MDARTKLELVNDEGETEVWHALAAGHAGERTLCSWCDHSIAANAPRLEREATASSPGVSVHFDHLLEMVADSVAAEQGEAE